jgi:mRNA export factor
MTYNYSSSVNRSYSSDIKAKEKDLPMDTVSSIVWDGYSQDPIFAASSWDGFVRLYMVSNNSSAELNKVFEVFLHHPVLCADFSGSGLLFAGLASGDVLVIEIQSGNYMSLGNHEAPICGIYWVNQFSLLMTLGFDNLIKFWRVQPENALQTQLELPLKTVTCSFDFPYLLIGSV